MQQHDSWPLLKYASAVQALAQASKLSPKEVALPTEKTAGKAPDKDDLPFYITQTASVLDLEAVEVSLAYHNIPDQFIKLGPTLIPVLMEGDLRLVALIGARRGKMLVLRPDRKVVEMKPQDLKEIICAPIAAKLDRVVEDVLEEARVAPRKQSRVRDRLLGETLESRPICSCYCLRLPPGADFFKQLYQARLMRYLASFIGIQLLIYFMSISAWYLLGRGALQASLDRGWMVAWMLMVLSIMPFSMLASWWKGMFSIGAGGLLKRRLLQGIFRLQIDQMRAQGAGQAFGRIVESQFLESSTLTVGMTSVMACIELILAAGIIGLGAGGWLHVLLFAAWVGVVVYLARRYYSRRRNWSVNRLNMTHDLVERMVGHQTRLAQEQLHAWHEEEDQLLANYLERSRTMDRSDIYFRATLSKAWLVLGFVGLTPALVAGQPSTEAIAVSIGGIMLAYAALGNFGKGISQLIDAAIAWRQSGPLFWAAAKKTDTAAPELIVAGDRLSNDKTTRTILTASDLSFRYRSQAKPVLDGCSLQIREGDRILIEGSSGGGKTTLAMLIAGLRSPESGLLLLRGYDWQTLGTEIWRKRVVVVPQFQENFIFSGTLAFNLLMGRRWPPTERDFKEARQICIELELGDLLERMPAGMNQMVGECGWRLSHGEKSRVYIARALLQNAELVLLDESFAALNPINLKRALDCVFKRSCSLLVIAHP